VRRLGHGGLSDCKRIMAATCPLLFRSLLHEPQLTKVRAALSEPFNDFPVEYDYLARKVRGTDPDALYEILYSEVAPVCFTNLVAAVPPVWTGFDPDILRESIEERLAARERNWFRREFDKRHPSLSQTRPTKTPNPAPQIQQDLPRRPRRGR